LYVVWIYLVSGCGCHDVCLTFTTRRSSDLGGPTLGAESMETGGFRRPPKPVPVVRRAFSRARGRSRKPLEPRVHAAGPRALPPLDRKSTRLNSSHVKISYAFFCMKKKTDNS